jgi:hypothetical protein
MQSRVAVYRRLNKALHAVLDAKEIATGRTWRLLHRVESNLCLMLGKTTPDHAKTRRRWSERAKRAAETRKRKAAEAK